MFEAIGDMMTHLMDHVVGWILHLPRDLRLFAVAVLTTGVMVVVRLWSTPQDWLRRADRDKKRLGRLIRQARRGGDKEAKARYKESLTLIKLRSVKYEGKPLLWAIIPVVLLAVWCFYRLGYQPIGVGQEVKVNLYVPASGIGRYAHLMPQEGLEAVDGWVQRVREDEMPEPEGWWDAFNARMSRWMPWVPEPVLGGVATWRLKTTGEKGRYTLRIRYRGVAADRGDRPEERTGKTYVKDILVGGRHYTDPITFVNDDPDVDGVEVVLKPMKLFGVIGGLDFLFLPPWLVAYLVIIIVGLPLIKRLTRIY